MRLGCEGLVESRASADSWMLGDAVKHCVVSGEKDCVLSSGKYFYDLKKAVLTLRLLCLLESFCLM